MYLDIHVYLRCKTRSHYLNCAQLNDALKCIKRIILLNQREMK